MKNEPNNTHVSYMYVMVEIYLMCFIPLFSCMVVFHSISIIWHGHPLSCLHGRNSKNRKKLMLVRIMNSVGMNSKNIMNNIKIFNDSAIMNNIFNEWYKEKQFFLWIMLGWIIILVNSVGSIILPKFPNVSVNQYCYFVWALWNIIGIFQGRRNQPT